VAKIDLDKRLLILVGLANGPKHGYALMKDSESTTGIRIGAGTLYGCLTLLEDSGLIVALPPEQRRQPYQLSELGRKELEGHLTDAARLSKLGLRRLATS
jgi:DNA-binding PadR family transcriptional regulator